MKKEVKKVDENELLRVNNNLKLLSRILIFIDVIAIILLIVQIKFKMVSYNSYIILVICNIITFAARIKSSRKNS